MPLPTLSVDGFIFEYLDSFLATKYDSWAFYRNQVSRILGAKAIDVIVAAQDASVAFLIEVKDFRVDPVTLERCTRTKPSELSDEIAAKVLDSLGGILAARTRASDDRERDAACLVCRARTLRVVLHLEQSSGSRLFPRFVDPANLQVKLRHLLKAVDPHVIVVSKTSITDLPWHVT